jgi:hypothetical protein
MSCNHKFLEDLKLENLNYKPTSLIVGTFNPAWPANNQAQWFYGRTRNNYFWDVLPALYQQAGLRNIPVADKPSVWKRSCQTNKIAITDLIRTVNDADELNNEHRTSLGNYSDNNIANRLTPSGSARYQIPAGYVPQHPVYNGVWPIIFWRIGIKNGIS